MRTIREVLESFEGEGSLDDLVEGLVAREEEAVGNLAVVASNFGVLPPIFSKVILDLGLGRPRSTDEAAFITAQYQTFMARLIANAFEVTGLPPESFGIPSTTPPEDPS